MALVFDGLVKLLEETSELQQVAAKKIAYFNTDEHPDSRGSLKERMEDEMGDVLAIAIFVRSAFNLNASRIEQRITEKLNLYHQWHGEE